MSARWDIPGLVDVAMEQVRNAVVITDADFAHGGPHVLLCNPAFLDLTGYREEEIVGQNLRILQGPQTDPAVIAELRECLRQGRYFEGQTVNYRKDGTPYIVRWSISPIHDEAGVVTHYVSVQDNLSERLRAESERDLLADVLEVVGEPIMVTGGDHRIEYVNRAFERVMGYRLAEVQGQTPWLLYRGADSEQRYAAVIEAVDRQEPVREQVCVRTKDGSLLYTVHSVSSADSALAGGPIRNISTFTDVTGLMADVEQLRVSANTDPLTRLPNRRAGEEALRSGLAGVMTQGRPMCVALCDLDHFKRINDTFGHGVGDRVLQRTATYISESMRAGDHAVRWGGEEFLLILRDLAAADAVAVCERIRAGLADESHDQVGPVTVSIGVTQVLPGEDSASFLARADEALYDAKRSGRNRVVQA